MKQIRLGQLLIENFKGCKRLSLDFAGQSASIYGDNATGKTTIYDSLNWLLFGKDSRGQSNFEIKPLATDGSVRDHSLISVVEAVFICDDERVKFRRTYYEKWTTKRGSSDALFDGNSSDFFVDDVPCKKYEFEKAVANLADEDVFRLLTGVSHFCGELDWKRRRELLFSICGTMTDQELMALDSRFLPLSEACGKRSVDGLKKKLQTERKGLSGVRNDVPVRLDECRKTVEELSCVDFASLRLERDRLLLEKKAHEATLVQLENNSLVQGRRNELGARRNELTALEHENVAFRNEQIVFWRDPRPDLARQISTLDIQISRLNSEKQSHILMIDHSRMEVERCREAWKSVQSEGFSGGTCPTCLQTLAGNALQEAQDSFHRQKDKRLKSIVSESEVHKSNAISAQEKIEQLEAQLKELESHKSEYVKQLQEIKIPKQKDVLNMPDYASKKLALERAIFELDGELLRLSGERRTVEEELREKLRALSDEIHKIEEHISEEGVLRFTEERMEALRREAQLAAEKIEALDKLLFLCEDFVRFQVQCVEDGVNSRFRLAKFRLFVDQVNGGLSDCCDVTFDGVPYKDLNEGMKVNIGLDVIQTLSDHYGVCVPLFVDNAERVTKIQSTDCQVIRLVVSENDNILRCEYGS